MTIFAYACGGLALAWSGLSMAFAVSHGLEQKGDLFTSWERSSIGWAAVGALFFLVAHSYALFAIFHAARRSLQEVSSRSYKRQNIRFELAEG